MVRHYSILLLLFTFVSYSSYGHDYTLGSINIDHPWSPQATPNSKTLAIYFQLKNSAKKSDTLLFVSSPIAKKVEIHTHTMVEDVMKMAKLEALKVRGKRLTLFRQGGLHLMLFEPSYIPAKGETFPLILTFKNAGEVMLDVAVEDKGHKHQH